MYAPQNFYCYALDAKSTALFHAQMRNLSKCFPNVLLAPREYMVDSAGHNTSRSFLECLRVVRKLPSWKYAILLQVYFFPFKIILIFLLSLLFNLLIFFSGILIQVA